MQAILFDDHAWENLLPLTFTRPVSDLRAGILTIAEKWEKDLDCSTSPLSRSYLRAKYPCEIKAGQATLFINASLLPDEAITEAIKALKKGEALAEDGRLIAVCPTAAELETLEKDPYSFDLDRYTSNGKPCASDLRFIDFPWLIFSLNGEEIESDFKRLTAGRKSRELPRGVLVDDPSKVFVEEGFKGSHFTLNTSAGPIYLGKNSEIMEGSLIRGPFALCEGSVLKMGAKIYGPTSIGPFSKAGGEINNSVLYGNSNKGHDGFLGNAVIGEWCNLGADTNNSNLKNNYAEVKIWNYSRKRFISTGRQFCGLIMGDHSKCGINTMFNTGTVVGVSANIFGSGFPRVFVPSFSWGGAAGMMDYKLEKVFETASLVMERRGQNLNADDRAILEHVFEYSKGFRKW